MADDLADQVLASGPVQPDSTTCGSSVLVMSRALNDPTYAGFLLHGTSTVAGAPDPGSVQDRFKEQALTMHRTTSGAKDSGGLMQIPWPRSLGTTPFAVAREMTNGAGEKGKKYGTRTIVFSGQRAGAFDLMSKLTHAGHVVPLFVGNRWSPRHVVLGLPSADLDDDEVLIYDPASGRRYPIEDDDFEDADLEVAGWNQPWAIVVPG